MSNANSSFLKASFLWDIFCFVSLGGIWPRFIEPKRLLLSRLEFVIPIRRAVKIVQISDLHFNEQINSKFIQKLLKKIQNEKADLIVITGDFLCNGKLFCASQLKNFLGSLAAPLGVFAVLGNHDYDIGLNINASGDYDAIESDQSFPLNKVLKRLFGSVTLTGKVTKSAKAACPHPGLLQIFKETSIALLDNQTVLIDDTFNLTGVGELMAGKVDPNVAFNLYDKNFPGIILAHNPDASKYLLDYPGQVILSGHTHGGQINIPGIWQKMTAMENPQFKSGLYSLKNKHLYISRGLGGVVPFRFNTPPELVSIQLTPKGNEI